MYMKIIKYMKLDEINLEVYASLVVKRLSLVQHGKHVRSEDFSYEILQQPMYGSIIIPRLNNVLNLI